ncbi:hypothetical protein JHK86_041684 [Glycine max]|nr:hypothetical protein JHK86_041684 [Glycine max]
MEDVNPNESNIDHINGIEGIKLSSSKLIMLGGVHPEPTSVSIRVYRLSR